MRNTSEQSVSIQEESGRGSAVRKPAGGRGAVSFLGLLAALWIFSSFSLQADPSSTANVTLAWDPSVEADLTGYNVYHGMVSRAYSGRMFVSRHATNVTITNLEAGQTYYFALTAINTAGLESDYSAEVSYTTPKAAVLQIQIAFNGQVILTVTGPVGHSYDIQASVDLRTWNVLSLVTIGCGGLAEQTVLNAPMATAMFYRVVEASLPDLQIRVASNRQVILTVTGTVSHNYDIQASSDFKTWAVIGNVTLGEGGSFEFADPSAAAFPRRFYRTRTPQP
jgi:hypothetical protein